MQCQPRIEVPTFMSPARAPSTVSVADAARQHVLAEHREVVRTTLACADRVAADLELPADRDAVVTALDRELEAAGAKADCVGLLREVVPAVGFDLLAEPVAASPYLVVTGRGVLLRVTVEVGRLVILLRGFEVDPGEGYVQASEEIDDVVETRFRRQPD